MGGTLGKFSVGGSLLGGATEETMVQILAGNVTDSLIGAGLISNAGAFDLEWLTAQDAFVNGSTIGKLDIKGTLTSTAGAGMPYGVGAWSISSVKVTGAAAHALVTSEV